MLALIVIYIPKAIFLIKLWLQIFRWVIGDLNPRTSDLETNTLPPHHQAVIKVGYHQGSLPQPDRTGWILDDRVSDTEVRDTESGLIL